MIRSIRTGLATSLLAVLLTSCAGSFNAQDDLPSIAPSQARALLAELLPARVKDREAWAQDIYAGFAALEIPASAEHFCAVIAVTEQEGGFAVDPVVPGLSKIAWKEIEKRAKKFHLPMFFVRGTLKVPSPNGKSFAERLDTVRTEQELSAIYEDMIRYVPLGQSLLASKNPVRTGGPMQVSIRFAEQHASHKTYPYPVEGSLRAEVFSRRGGLYFGVAHLLDYPTQYDRLIYRYADFNAGQHASRNAAFQNAVSLASGIPLKLDGDLLAFDVEGQAVRDRTGATELATRVLADRINMSEKAIRRELERSREARFSKSKVYQRVFELADAVEQASLPRAMIPDIKLSGPKISRNLTTRWFAERVAKRHASCMKRVPDGV